MSKIWVNAQDLKENAEIKKEKEVSALEYKLFPLVERCQSRYSTCFEQFKRNRNHKHQFT